MWKKKKYRNAALIEGQKEAILIARKYNLPEPNHDFDDYPVDLTFPKERSEEEAIKMAKELSNLQIYNVFFEVGQC